MANAKLIIKGNYMNVHGMTHVPSRNGNMVKSEHDVDYTIRYKVKMW
jgi:hypothetical protein